MKPGHSFYGFAVMAAVSLAAFGCGSDSGSDDGGASTGSGGTSSTSSGGSAGKASGSGGSTSSGGTSSSTGGTGSCDPTSDPTGSGTSCPAYVECAQAKCATQYQTCLGAGYESGDFSGGSCETFMECTAGCNCDSTCSQNCFDNAGTACNDCLLNTIGNCVITNCFNEALSCSGSGGTGGTGSGGTGAGGTTGSTKTCADLQTCCNSLSGTDKSDCTTLYDQVKAGGDTACGVSYQIYQLNGLCQ